MITVELLDARGARVGAPWRHPLADELLRQAADAGACALRFLDPRGDATFDHARLPALIDELRAYCIALPDGELAAVGEGLAEFLRDAAARPGVRVRFAGLSG